MIIITDGGDYALQTETMDTLRADQASDDFGPLLENLTGRSWDIPESVAQILLPEGATYTLREVTPSAQSRFISIANLAKSNAVDENIDMLIRALVIQSGLGVYDDAYTETYRCIDQKIADGIYRPDDIAGVLDEMNSRGFYGYDHISTMMMSALNTAITDGDVDSIDPASLVDADFNGIDEDSNIWKLLTTRNEYDVMQILYQSYSDAFDAGTPFLGLSTAKKESYDSFAAYAMPHAKNGLKNPLFLK